MRILITGGAGFIGSALVHYLLAHTNAQVLNVDKITYAGRYFSVNGPAACERYRLVQQDIIDTAAISALFTEFQPDYLIHLAAESHVDNSILAPNSFIETNIVGTYSMLEACLHYWRSLPAAKKQQFRFHHVSTDEVYGDLAEHDPAAAEGSFYRPSSPYSASKAASDHLVRAWHRTYGLPVVMTLCSNNYGPYQYPEKLIPLMIHNALSGQPLPVYGNGLQIRDWIYVDDHVRGLYQIITSGVTGETYHFGGNNQQKNLDVVDAICRLLDELHPQCKPASGSYADLIQFVSDRPGHDYRYAMDTAKVARELGWQPLESFETGLRKTVNWYLQNMQWFNTLQEKGQTH